MPVNTFSPILNTLRTPNYVPSHPYSTKISSSPSSQNSNASLAQSPPTLPHLTPSSSVHVIDISHKLPTQRTALATGHITFSTPTAVNAIRSHLLRKGDVLSVARVAGIQAVKRTSDIIPLAHSGLPIEGVDVRVEVVDAESAKGDGGDQGEGGILPSEASGTAKKDLAGAMDLSKPIGKHGGVRITVKASTTSKTGVEMEALTGVMGAALTVVDMVKSVDKGVVIQELSCVGKKGGRSGAWGVFSEERGEGDEGMR